MSNMRKGRPQGGAMGAADPRALGRAVKKLFEYYPVMAPLTMFCILFSSVVSSIPSLFVQNVLSVIEKWYLSGDWASAKAEIIPYITLLAALYVLSLISMTAYTQLMAYMTQGYLDKLRREMFDDMQDLPISYFDTHQHGDIMSHYTNDIDTLRMLISQSLPTLIQSGAIVLVVLAIMLYSRAVCRRSAYVLRCQALRRRLGALLRETAALCCRYRGLRAGDDERPKGHQGILPRRAEH